MATCKRGFSLVELCVVLAILLVLSGALVAPADHHRVVARQLELDVQARQIEIACECYHRARGRWPASVADLEHAELLAGDRVWPWHSRVYQMEHSVIGGPPLAERTEGWHDASEDTHGILLEPSAPGRRDVAGARVVPIGQWLAARPAGGHGW